MKQGEHHSHLQQPSHGDSLVFTNVHSSDTCPVTNVMIDAGLRFLTHTSSLACAPGEALANLTRGLWLDRPVWSPKITGHEHVSCSSAPRDFQPLDVHDRCQPTGSACTVWLSQTEHLCLGASGVCCCLNSMELSIFYGSWNKSPQRQWLKRIQTYLLLYSSVG